MIAYFLAVTLLLISLSVVRIADADHQARSLEVGLYRASYVWFVLLTLIHIGFLAALFYGLLLPWIANKAIAAFPPAWFAARERKLAWFGVALGWICLFAVVCLSEWPAR